MGKRAPYWFLETDFQSWDDVLPAPYTDPWSVSCNCPNPFSSAGNLENAWYCSGQRKPKKDRDLIKAATNHYFHYW